MKNKDLFCKPKFIIKEWTEDENVSKNSGFLNGICSYCEEENDLLKFTMREKDNIIAQFCNNECLNMWENEDVTSEQEETKEHRLTLRIPNSIMMKIDNSRKKRIGKISRNQFILEILDNG